MKGRVLLWVGAEDTVLVVGVQVEVRGGVRCAQQAAVSAPLRAADGGVARHAQAAALQVEEQLPGVAGRGERPPVVHRRGAVIAAGQRVLGQRHQVQEVCPGLWLICIIYSYSSSSCCYNKAQHQALTMEHGHGYCNVSSDDLHLFYQTLNMYIYLKDVHRISYCYQLHFQGYKCCKYTQIFI